jgi:hypothetical protein
VLAVLAEEHSPKPPCAAPSAPSTPRGARDGRPTGRARARLEASGGGGGGGGGGGAAGDKAAARRRSRARRGAREERGPRPWESQPGAPRQLGVLHVPLHAADFAAPPRSSEPPLRGAAAAAHHTAAAVLPTVSAQCLAGRLDPDSAAQQAHLQLLWERFFVSNQQPRRRDSSPAAESVFDTSAGAGVGAVGTGAAGAGAAAAATAATGWDAPLLAPQVRRGAQATQHSYGLTEVSAMLAELVSHRPGARVHVVKAEAAAVVHLHHLRR